MIITIFGDSTSKGLYLEDGRIKRIEHTAVDIISQTLGININNNSMFGQTLKRFCDKKFLESFIEQLDPNQENTVIFCLGGNDSDFLWDEVEKDPNGLHGSFTNPDFFYELLYNTVTTLKQHNVDVILTSLFPIDSKRYFETQICQKHNRGKIMHFLNEDVDNIYRHHEQFNSLIVRCAFACKCEFIDFRTPLLQKTDLLEYLSFDGIHPNQKGHEFVAQEVIKYLNNRDIK